MQLLPAPISGMHKFGYVLSSRREKWKESSARGPRRKHSWSSRHHGLSLLAWGQALSIIFGITFCGVLVLIWGSPGQLQVQLLWQRSCWGRRWHSSHRKQPTFKSRFHNNVRTCLFISHHRSLLTLGAWPCQVTGVGTRSHRRMFVVL